MNHDHNLHQHRITLVHNLAGRAVFSTRKFNNGEFLLFYEGELIDRDEGERREYEEETGYRYFFDHTTSDGKMKGMW